MAGKERTTRTLIALVLATTATLVGIAPAAHGASVVPASGVLFGTHISPRWRPRPVDPTDGVDAGSQVRHHAPLPRVHRPVLQAGDQLDERRAGFRWRPGGPPAPHPMPTAPPRSPAHSEYDSTIRSVARGMKKVPGPILVRFALEMTQAPDRSSTSEDGPRVHRCMASRREHLRRRGRANVQWVLGPPGGKFCNGRARCLYPGDAYVDWIAGTTMPPSESSQELHRPLQLLLHLGRHQAAGADGEDGLCIEVASQPNWKANWMAGMLSSLKVMPKIKALI